MSTLWSGYRSVARRCLTSAACTSSLATGRRYPLSRSTSTHTSPPGGRTRGGWRWGKVVAGGGLALAGLGLVLSHNKNHFLTAECTAKQERDEVKAGQVQSNLPSYSRAEISAHKTQETGVWVTYRDGVYDVTEFLPQHPGGTDKIMLAAGAAVDPYWLVFGQHNSTEVQDMLEEYRIGNIVEEDRQTVSQSSKEGPYAKDPVRSPIFKVNTSEPFNAETPPVLLPEHFNTPNDIFFVRNHLPVPEVDAKAYTLDVNGPGLEHMSLTLEDLKNKFPQHTVTATIQCAGNRREELGKVKEVKGISWTGGAIGNASWTGVRLRDVLAYAGLKQSEDEEGSVKHIHLEGLDHNPLTGECYGASIPVEKALSPSGDCLLVHTMNGETLPCDHGYPVRAIIPGTVGARNVKWLSKIVASEQEYGGQWQQRDYKGFCPSVDWSNVDFSKSPAIQELPVTSLICSPQEGCVVSTEEQEELTVQGIAWSGGGREVVRVDVSADGGKSWQEAELKEGTGQRRGRAWAWTTWEATVPVTAASGSPSGTVELCCKAVDSSYNVQPDTTAPIWNLRGCLSNAWHRIHVQLK